MKKKILLVISVLLAVITFALVGNYNTKAYAVADTVIMNNGKTYEKITNVVDVTDGNYIIGAEGKEAFAGAFSKSYYQNVNTSEEAIVFTFIKGTTGFKIKNQDKFVTSSSAKTIKEVTDEVQAEEVSVSMKGTSLELKFKGGFLKYNSNAPRFTTYTSGQTNIELFKEKVLSPDTKTYTVSFNTMGGNLLDSLVFAENDTLATLPEPEKPGMIFEGWYKEETLVNKWDSLTDKLTNDITLYAKWIDTPYIKVTTLEDLVSAEYYLSANDNFVSTYGNSRLSVSNVFEEAIKFKFIVNDNTAIISFDNNGVTTYLNCNGKTDVLSTTNYNEAYKFTLSLDSKGEVLINGQGGRALCLNGDYFRFYSPSTYTPATLLKIKGSEIDMNEENIKQISTLASLKVDYDATTLEATDIDLRFGTIIPTNLFNNNAKYGVVITKKSSNITFTSGLQTEADINSFVTANTGAKFIQANPCDVANGKQFAWVINNIEAQELKYNESFISTIYMEVDNKLYFAQSKEASVKDIANIYITDTTLNIPTNVIEVLKKIV